MRFNVSDEPGVLSQITGILGEHGISISSIIQHEPTKAIERAEPTQPTVPLVIMTHHASESAASTANEAIRQLSSVRGDSVYLRVADNDQLEKSSER
jgi:homoserine dehydrogenase